MHVTQQKTFEFEGRLLKALQDNINSLASILEDMGERRAGVEDSDEKESFHHLRAQVKNIRDHAIEEQRKLTKPTKPRLLLASSQ